MLKQLRLMRMSKDNAIACSKVVDSDVQRLHAGPAAAILEARGVTPEHSRAWSRAYVEKILGTDWYRSIIAHRAAKKPLGEAIEFWDEVMTDMLPSIQDSSSDVPDLVGGCLAIHAVATGLIPVDEDLSRHTIRDGARVMEWLESTLSISQTDG